MPYNENMDIKLNLATIAKELVAPPKGILAADESTKTCCARFEGVGVECSEEKRREYREILITTPKNENYLTGIIMVDETVRQKDVKGTPFLKILKQKGIHAGIKVDGGLDHYDGDESVETVTIVPENLAQKLKEYADMGITFAKWRSAFIVGNSLPSDGCIKENVRRMIEYAKLCQNVGIVPIVEPEVLIDGSHSAEESEIAIGRVLVETKRELLNANLYLPGLIIKTSMAVSGKDSANRADRNEVAKRTIDVLKTHIPEDIGGVVFLSGGQTPDEADRNFDAIMRHASEVPFPMTLSFARAIQNPVIKLWAEGVNKEQIEKVFINQINKIETQ